MTINFIPFRQVKKHRDKRRAWYNPLLGGYLAGIVATGTAIDDTRDPVPGPIPATVLRVIDGDTLEVRALIWIGQEVKTNVRLADIDAPELRGKCAEEKAMAERAKLHLMVLVADGQVLLYDVTPDKYGRRVIARVVNMQGVDLTGDLIRNGLARFYRGGARQGWC